MARNGGDGAGTAIGAAWGVSPKGDLARRLATKWSASPSEGARFGDHRRAGRLQGRRSSRPVVFSTGVHRRTGAKWGPIMAGMGYWRRQMEHCPEEGLAPRRTEEVECLAASEGALWRLLTRRPAAASSDLAAYRLLRRPSPPRLCGSGPTMAGYRRSRMEHCREYGLVVRRAEEGCGAERRRAWRPSGCGRVAARLSLPACRPLERPSPLRRPETEPAAADVGLPVQPW